MNPRRGFSLIEVLIAVVALAIGLLGLAAVFPVIVGQQRDASNAAAAESYTRSVRAFLNAHEPLQNPNSGWSQLAFLLGESSPGQWSDFASLYDGTDITWDALSGPDIVIPVRERLWPTETARPAGPRLVWDLAAYVPDLGPNDLPEPMRVAVFVRPVDGSIRDRVDRSRTVWDMLDPPNGSPDRLPIGETNNRPTRDGTGNYAALFPIDVSIVDVPGGTRNGLVVTAVGGTGRSVADAEAVLGRVGQRIVDRQGNVYRVTGSRREGNALQMRITPSVPGGLVPADVNPCIVSSVPPAADPFIVEINP